MTVEMESVATVGTGETVLNKFLSFRLGAEEYGVEILRVREIIGVLDITPLPHGKSRKTQTCHPTLSFLFQSSDYGLIDLNSQKSI